MIMADYFQIRSQDSRLNLVLLYSSLVLVILSCSLTHAQSQSTCSDICAYNDHEWFKLANCSNRRLTSVPSVCKTAKTLLLNNNPITSLNPDAFQEFTSLKNLYLRNTNMGDILPNAFRGLGNLEYLKLGGNCFKDLTSETLRGLDNLVFLMIVEGYLENVAANTFESLPNLGTLELGGNRLREPLCDAFGKGNMLKYLTLADNLIESLPNFCFSELGMLEILSLDGNNLTEIRSGEELLGLDNLQKLTLDRTSLIRIPGGLFENTPNLRHLSLARNGLSNIPGDVFSNLLNLTFFNLSHNAMDHVMASLFQNNLRLKTIDLSANRISQIEAGSFSDLDHLQTLLLPSNNLRIISQLIMEVPWMSFVNLESNPLQCECAILELGDWLDRNAEYAEQCVSPSNYKVLRDRSLQNLCDGNGSFQLTSPEDNIGDSRLTEYQEPDPNLPEGHIPSDKQSPTSLTKSNGHTNTRTQPLNVLGTTNIIILAITLIVPVIFVAILLCIVYQCHRILRTSERKSWELSPLPAEGSHTGLIGEHRPPRNGTQFNRLGTVASSNEMGDDCDDEGLYEEFSDVEANTISPCLALKKINKNAVDDPVDVKRVEVFNDTYVPYDPPRPIDMEFEIASDNGKTATGRESDYYNLTAKEPLYDSKIPRYANERQFVSS